MIQDYSPSLWKVKATELETDRHIATIVKSREQRISALILVVGLLSSLLHQNSLSGECTTHCGWILIAPLK